MDRATTPPSSKIPKRTTSRWSATASRSSHRAWASSTVWEDEAKHAYGCVTGDVERLRGGEPRGDEDAGGHDGFGAPGGAHGDGAPLRRSGHDLGAGPLRSRGRALV